jgi:hypothetical protein
MSVADDFAGRRTKIERPGAKLWEYGYDANNNMTWERVPRPGGATVSQYTNTMAYDALDRLTSKVLGSRGMSTADRQLFGAANVTYQWDTGAARTGRLRYVRHFGPSSTTPVLLEDMQYDGQGNRTFLYHSFASAGFTITRDFGLRYFGNGQPSTAYYRDYVGGTNETVASYEYDARGLPWNVKVLRTGEPTQMVALQTRNVAGLVTNRRKVTGRMISLAG